MTTTPEPLNTLYDTIFVGDGEMAVLMRSHDWSNTPLGPVETWSQSLRTSVSTMLASPLPQGVFWGDDYIQLYNDAMTTLYGANHPQALGQPIRETWSEVWEDRAKPMWEGIKNTGKPIFAENQHYALLRFDYLEEAYFTICYSPIWDETGKISGILCTSPETTQQVISQRRLTMLRELATAGSGAKTLQSACLAAVDTLNPYDIPFALFYQVNAQGNLAELVATSGLSADSAAASPTIPLTLPSDTTTVFSDNSGWSLAEVFQSREPQLMTDVGDRFRALPGGPWAESPHSAFILPILSGNKEQVECLLVVGVSPRLPFDSKYRSFLELVAQQVESTIATARGYEAERKRAEALAELDRAKTTFFSNVSHEFRTPLTLILSPLEEALGRVGEWESAGMEAVQNSPSPPLALASSLKEQLQLAHRNSLRLLKLVNTLLDFSQIETDRISAVYEPIELATFTTELASVFRSAIEKANLRLVVDCSPLPELIYVDREMWEKIVLNLISNAFKFTFTGEIRVSLRVGEWESGGVGEWESGRVGEWESGGVGEWESEASTPHPLTPSPLPIILEVQDTGIGIPATEIPRLFERFYRVKSAQGRTLEGSGIGLSLVQELVKLHGGTVEVSSVEGEGSCFRVLIPTGFTHLPAERITAGTGGLSKASGRLENDLPSPFLLPTAIGAAPFVEEALRWLPAESERVDEWTSERVSRVN